MLGKEGLAVLRGSTSFPPLLEYHISALGQFPLILVFPRLLARCVTSGFVFSCACLNQSLGDLTECGYLRGGGGMISLSCGGQRCSLVPCQSLNHRSRKLSYLFGYMHRDRLYIFGRGGETALKASET